MARPAGAPLCCTWQLSAELTVGRRLAGRGRVLLQRRDHAAAAGPGEAQDLVGQLFDDIGVAGAEQVHVPLQAGAQGLEARDLRLQLSGAFDQSTPRLEATLTDDGVIGEIAQRKKTEKRHQDLSRPAFAPIVHGRTWGATRDLERPTGTRGKVRASG